MAILIITAALLVLGVGFLAMFPIYQRLADAVQGPRPDREPPTP